MRKILRKIFLMLTVFSLLAVSLSPADVQAASKNRKACQAFARAVASGKIKYNAKRSSYSLCDVDGDGVKELLIYNSYTNTYTFWKYSKGKISKLLAYTPEFTLAYDKKTKTFWEWGEGDGGWIVGHKLRGNKLEETGMRYSSGYDPDRDKIVTEKIVNGKSYKISKKEYQRAWQAITEKNAFSLRNGKKAQLIQYLLNVK